jgi:hypothetical protein
MAAKRRSVTEEGDENWMPCGTCDRDGASWAQRCRQQQTGSPLAPCAALRSAASFGSVCAEIGQETRKRSRESASRCRHGRKQGRERRGSWDETTGGGSEVFGLVGIWTEGREPWTCKTEACVQSFCRKKKAVAAAAAAAAARFRLGGRPQWKVETTCDRRFYRTCRSLLLAPAG